MHIFRSISAVAAIAAAIAAPASAAIYNGAGFNIPAVGTSGSNSSSIAIADAGTVQNIRVTLNNLTHSFSGDLTITLTNGTTSVDLVDNLGVNAALNNCISTCGANYGGTYSFGDSFAGLMWSSEEDTVASGEYRATTTEGALSFLSAFDGASLAGLWTLVINDQIGGDFGVLGSWSMEVDAGDVPEPAMLGLFGLGAIGLGLSRRRKA